MAWFFLAIAGLFEIAWAVALKQSDGFTKLWPSVAFLVTASISLYLLSLALRSIPIGSAYAIWTGIGAVGIAIVGISWFSEPAGIFRICCIAFIVIGIVGLKISGSGASVV